MIISFIQSSRTQPRTPTVEGNSLNCSRFQRGCGDFNSLAGSKSILGGFYGLRCYSLASCCWRWVRMWNMVEHGFYPLKMNGESNLKNHPIEKENGHLLKCKMVHLKIFFPWKRRLCLETFIFRFHVKLWGCIKNSHPPDICSFPLEIWNDWKNYWSFFSKLICRRVKCRPQQVFLNLEGQDLFKMSRSFGGFECNWFMYPPWNST